MTNKPYDYLVFLGRFQPFHNGHKHVVDTALNHAKHVLVLAGSANISRCQRNPFTFNERKTIIESIYPDNVTVLPVDDFLYNDGEWVRSVQRTVNDHLRIAHKSTSYEDLSAISDLKIGLIGHSKDESSYYLKLFPTWGSIDVQGLKDGQHKVLNATDIRNHLFDGATENIIDLVPSETLRFLSEFSQGEIFNELLEEANFVKQYKKQWENVPYPVTFVTTDSVVVQSGHVLMVRRGAQPGKGKLALPGGFLNQNETLLDGALRELREETGLKVPVPVLKGSLKKQHTFDNPHRSARGRTITTAFLFDLTPQTSLPKIRAGDDAEHAEWIPLSQIKASDCFEDHWAIIRFLTSTL